MAEGRERRPEPLLDWTGIQDEAAREASRRSAYEAVFGSPAGRLVLRDILIGAGVGRLQGPPNGVAGWRDYAAGQADCALTIMETAGIGQSDLARRLADNEEGYFDERTDFE